MDLPDNSLSPHDAIEAEAHDVTDSSHNFALGRFVLLSLFAASVIFSLVLAVLRECYGPGINTMAL